MDIVIEQKNKNKLSYRYTKNDSPITIGRHKCTIDIDSSSISKIHCSLYFNSNSNSWEINDGGDNKLSLHGTWLWITQKVEIQTDTQIKLGDKIFSISMY